MKVAIIGVRGALGAELLRVLGPADVVALDLPECDVTQPATLESAFAKRHVDVVVNLASYNRVDESEQNPVVAFTVNAAGAFHVARCARARGAAVCHVSTDYVFGADEKRRTPYDEDAPPGPVNAYGASKLAGEQLVRMSNPEHLIVRTSALFGVVTSRKGTTFPEVMLAKAAARERIRVVNDQTTAPTSARDLAARMAELLRLGARGTVHVVNSGSCTWYEFAREVFRQAGLSAEVEPITSEQLGAPARRPAYSVLTSRRLGAFGLAPLRPWADALRDYVREKTGAAPMAE